MGFVLFEGGIAAWSDSCLAEPRRQEAERWKAMEKASVVSMVNLMKDLTALPST